MEMRCGSFLIECLTFMRTKNSKQEDESYRMHGKRAQIAFANSKIHI